MVNEAREIRTPNLLIWSQTRCRCAIAPSGPHLHAALGQQFMTMGRGLKHRLGSRVSPCTPPQLRSGHSSSRQRCPAGDAPQAQRAISR